MLEGEEMMTEFDLELANGAIEHRKKVERQELRDWFALHATEEDIKGFMMKSVGHGMWAGTGLNRAQARYAFADEMIEARKV